MSGRYPILTVCCFDSSPCLPAGYLALEPCYPDIAPPLAVSFPHGLHSPANSLLTHPPAPSPAQHALTMDIVPELGVPLAVAVRFQVVTQSIFVWFVPTNDFLTTYHFTTQLSAILSPDPVFPVLNKLNSTRLVPLFWASEGFDGPTDWMVQQVGIVVGCTSLHDCTLLQTRLALALPAATAHGLAALSCLAGLLTLATAIYRQRRRKLQLCPAPCPAIQS